MNTFEKIFEYIFINQSEKIIFYDKDKNRVEYDCESMKHEILVVSNYIKNCNIKLKKGEWIRLVSEDNHATFFVMFAMLKLGYNVLLAAPNYEDVEDIQEIQSSIYYHVQKENMIDMSFSESDDTWGEWIGFYSSGTMGFQKKFVYHADTVLKLLSNVRSKIQNSDINEILEKNDKFAGRSILNTLPIYHVLGLFLPIVMTSFSCNIVYCNHTSIYDVIAVIQKEQILGAFGVPVFWELMRNIANRRHYASTNPMRALLGNQFQMILSGGSKTKKELRTYYTELGIDFFVGYGMTEIGFLSVSDKNLEDINSEGSMYPMYDYKVLNEKGELSSTGEGELLVDTKGVYSYCFKDGKVHKLELFKGKYFKTGDIFSLQGDKLYFKGRKKNIIVCSNGENIFVEDIENKLEMIHEMKFMYGIAEYNGMVSLYLSNANHEITQIGLEKMIAYVKNVNKTLYISSKIKKIILINEKIDVNAKGKLLTYKLNENSDMKVVDIL